MRQILENALSNWGYAKKGDWFSDEYLSIKLNKKSITTSSEDGVCLFRRANPDKITLDEMEKLIQISL